MISLELPLIGPAASVLGAVRELPKKNPESPIVVLCDGNPGIGKTHLLDMFALELTKSRFAVEHINGQSLGIEIVREWRERAAYGNLFSEWTVKRIDEIDEASRSAVNELLSYLDYLPARHAVLASTNNYSKLRANTKGRLETRFVRFNAPLPAVTAGGHIAVAEPFLVQVAHGNGKDKKADNRRARSIADPLPAVCGNRGDMALCSPSLLPQQSGGALRSVDAPAPTVATDGAIGLVEPFLVKFYGAANGAQSIKEPLDTVTVKDRHALVRPIVVIRGQKYLLDIRFRMLQPHELAGAQGFPRDYKFTGTKTEQVKLIGNAVPRRLARAIVYAVLSQRSDCDQLLCAE